MAEFPGPFGDRPMSDKEADERAFAVGTMMGEGGPNENAYGYGGILDTIENRISAVKGGANYGSKGNTSIEGITTARGGLEYNAWMPSKKDAYGHAQAGLKGNPKAGAQKDMYDQAIKVYDDYYGKGTFKGSAMGGTFYQQNANLAGKKAGAYQRNMQAPYPKGYGSMPMGVAGHVVTGPAYYGPGSSALTGSFGSNYPAGQWSDDIMGRTPAGYEPVPAAITGSFGTNLLNSQPRNTPQNRTIKGGSGKSGLKGGSPGDDLLMDEQPLMLAQAPVNAVAKVAGRSISTTPPMQTRAPVTPQAPPPQAAPQIGPRESYWTPGPVGRAPGSNATGLETRRDPSGVIYDNNGAYGGGQAFGPQDPFGGLGYTNTGYADVLDKFDAQLGITRTVKDRAGNVIDQMTVGGKRDSGPTGLNESGSASRGDGSYAESAGYNDNNPQGIL